MSGTRSVAVVGGGRSSEHEVSLASAAAVANGLRGAGYLVQELTIGRDGVWWAGRLGTLGASAAASLAIGLELLAQSDVVFPVLHGPCGEDGTLAALCELAGLAYVGSGVASGALAMDKWATKLVAREVGVATAEGVLLGNDGTPNPVHLSTFRAPFVVKPVTAGSSHGVTLVNDDVGFAGAVAQARRFDDRVLVEEVVEGREIDIAVLRRSDGALMVSPALEIVGEGVFDAATKYDGTADFRVPAALTVQEHAGLVEAALAMFAALGCDGVARVDFFMTDDSAHPVLCEVNTTPGMTAHSQVPRMFQAAGWRYPELLADLVEGAWARRGKASLGSRRSFALPSLARRYPNVLASMTKR